MRTTTEQMAELTAQMARTALVMHRTFENLHQVSQQVKDGKGSVGRFVQDDGVYQHLERTLTTVDSLVKDIKRDPTRYFKFSVF